MILFSDVVFQSSALSRLICSAESYIVFKNAVAAFSDSFLM
ncbi:hypothetical protein MTBBW1_340031 [Desulfamplus magnetovallimortis]|uniref:Uncharacterized protein n=1 Tax=Desulfamplus magnetovallimortis TaxID=1246637 RepID=A0A1W1HG76_9BACT|nr:hypothetical protein MTBBW1_340031 [Desulfamplus magnetovallimortis]